jgi:hypothetical protein
MGHEALSLFVELNIPRVVSNRLYSDHVMCSGMGLVIVIWYVQVCIRKSEDDKQGAYLASSKVYQTARDQLAIYPFIDRLGRRCAFRFLTL